VLLVLKTPSGARFGFAGESRRGLEGRMGVEGGTPWYRLEV